MCLSNCILHIHTYSTRCYLIEAGRLKFIEYGFVKTVAGLLESEQLSVELQETILDLFANLAETGIFDSIIRCSQVLSWL